MINSHVKIIAFQTITNHSFWTFYIGGKPVVYIINTKIHGCLEIQDVFLVYFSFLPIKIDKYECQVFVTRESTRPSEKQSFYLFIIYYRINYG